MDRQHLQRWLDDYVAAWRSYEEIAIKALFSSDATYYSDPFDQALRGPEAIAMAWLAEPDPAGSWSADYRAVAVDGEIGVGRGITSYLANGDQPAREYANLFLLRFDKDGRCREYVEWYIKRRRLPSND